MGMTGGVLRSLDMGACLHRGARVRVKVM